MGYFGSATVLTSEPDWQRLDSLTDLHSLRGYKHNEKSLWLIETGYCQGNPPENAFTDYPECRPKVTPGTVHASLFDAKKTILDLMKSIGEPFHGFDKHLFDVPLRLSAALGQDLFFFAADDESTDFACRLNPAGIASFTAKSYYCLYQFESGKHKVKLVTEEEEPGKTDHLENCKAIILRKHPKAQVEISEYTEDFSDLYSCAVKHWPEAAGDPEQTLMIGTWDPFTNVPDDYTIVYEKVFVERTTPSPGNLSPLDLLDLKPIKPWWKFW